MKAAAAALILIAVTSCSGPSPAGPSRQPGGELVVTFERGHHRVYEVTDGSLVADLGRGVLVSRLNEGGDIAEAYLVGPEPEGIRRVQPGRPFVITKVAPGPAPGSELGSYWAALVPAPGLTSFVGQRNVLIVLLPDATMIGYQAGTEIWRRSAAPYFQLGAVGEAAVLFNRQNQTAIVAPENGVITLLSSDPNCSLVGLVRSERVTYCRGPAGDRLLVGNRVLQLPAGSGQESSLSTLFPVARDELFLYFGSGDLCHLAEQLSCRRALPHLGPVALSPEGQLIFAVDGTAILEQQVAGGSEARRLKSDVVYTGLGTSRDGTFVYALGGGNLDIWSLRGSGRRVRRYPAAGNTVEIIAGG